MFKQRELAVQYFSLWSFRSFLYHLKGFIPNLQIHIKKKKEPYAQPIKETLSF